MYPKDEGIEWMNDCCVCKKKQLRKKEEEKII